MSDFAERRIAELERQLWRALTQLELQELRDEPRVRDVDHAVLVGRRAATRRDPLFALPDSLRDRGDLHDELNQLRREDAA